MQAPSLQVASLEGTVANQQQQQQQQTVIQRIRTHPPHPYTTCLLEHTVDSSLDNDNDNTITLPSILFDFLECASRRIPESKDRIHATDALTCRRRRRRLCNNKDSLSSSDSIWYTDELAVLSSSENSFKIQVQVLFQEVVLQEQSRELDESMLQEAFMGRFVTRQSISMLEMPGVIAIVMIHDIVSSLSSSSSSFNDMDIAYYLDERKQQQQQQLFQVELISSLSLERHIIASSSPPVATNYNTHAPGYETTVHQLHTLLLESPVVAKPTGILVTGCAGVGKTRLVQAALQNFVVQWISVTDLLLQAAWQSSEAQEVRNSIQPRNDVQIIVWDDLQDIYYSSSNDDQESMEKRFVKNCLLHFMDTDHHDVLIVGVCREDQVPIEFTKTGRLETTVVISPPTQSQREQILVDLLQSSLVDDMTRKWASRLAEVTPGCVAQDLYRLCSDARMRARADDDDVPLAWEHLREVAEACIPSQLAMLDVSKPRLSETRDTVEHHQESWKALAGYESVKKRVFRTVVLPWKRFMDSPDGAVSFPPPRGVLFHGPSGCGKTLAAECLGESLGLPMIRVHAADILDKYVGGSEAALRSLFARARAASPCILFMDEIDSIASNRANDGEEVNVMSRLLSTLLNEMDGVSSQSGQMLIVACTNRLDSLDTALLRPGRLEEHILLERPTCSDIQAILQTTFSRIECGNDVDLFRLSELLQGWTSARVAGVARDAILSWIRQTQGKGLLMKSHFQAEVLSVW